MEAALALHSELSLEAVLKTLVARASALTGARQAGLGVVDRAAAGFERVVGDADVLQRAADSDGAGVLSATVVIRGAPYATVAVGERPDGGAFTSDDEEVLDVLSDHAAVAIENARLYESATRWLAQLEALGEIGNTLASEHDLSRLLEGVCRHLRELL